MDCFFQIEGQRISVVLLGGEEHWRSFVGRICCRHQPQVCTGRRTNISAACDCIFHRRRDLRQARLHVRILTGTHCGHNDKGACPCITPDINASHAGASHTSTACGSAGAFYSTAAGDASGSAGTFPSAATAGASAIHAARRAPRGHGAHTCATLGLASGLRRAMRGFVFVDPCTTDVVTAVPRYSTGDARSSADVSDAEATGDTSNVGRCR